MWRLGLGIRRHLLRSRGRRVGRNHDKSGEVDRHDRALLGFLGFVGEHRKSWMVLYRQAIGQTAFASQVQSSRDRLIELTAGLLEMSTKDPEPGQNFALMAVALVGAGEAVADRVAGGEIEVDDAADLLENLAWRGLAGKKSASTP